MSVNQNLAIGYKADNEMNEMNETLLKVRQIIKDNRIRHGLDNMSETELIDFLCGYQCIRDRLITKLDIKHYL